LQYAVRCLGWLTLLAAVIVPAGVYLILTHRAAQALRDAETEANRISPGWRLEEIEAARATPRRNSAHCVVDAAAQLPPSWGTTLGKPADRERRLGVAIAAHAPGECLKAEEFATMRKAVDAAMPAIALARALADQPDGRYAIVWNSDVFSTLLPHIEKLSDVATLLACDALLYLHDGDIDETLNSSLALLNAGRSIGDEPLLISQLARTHIVEKACRLTEHVLVHGEPSDAALAELGRALDRDEAEPSLWWAVRGERGAIDRFFACVEAGEFTREQLRKITGEPDLSLGRLAGASLVPGAATDARAAVLRYLSKAVEIAKLPPEHQLDALAKLEANGKDMPTAAAPFVPSLRRGLTAIRQLRTRLRCASAAIAAERYRLARSQWPASLEELVPIFLKQVPDSPIDGKPLRFRRLADGVTIRSVDDSNTEYRDLGFRLWDPQARQPSAQRTTN
jgi:hypothetical protein